MQLAIRTAERPQRAMIDVFRGHCSGINGAEWLQSSSFSARFAVAGCRRCRKCGRLSNCPYTAFRKQLDRGQPQLPVISGFLAGKPSYSAFFLTFGEKLLRIERLKQRDRQRK